MNVFIFSSTVFGGHEMMAAKIVNAVLLTSSVGVKVLVSKEIYNKLISVLDESVEVQIVNFKQRRFENLLGLFNPFIYQDLFRFSKYIDSNVSKLIFVNGGICANHATTLSFMALAKFKKIFTCVYYPMFHDQNELGLSFVRGLSYNRACARVVNLSDEFVTIDEFWRTRLLDVFGNRNVKIIHNYVGKSECNNAIRSIVNVDSPNKLEGHKSKIVGFVGRFDKYQKGLDILLRVIYILDLKLDSGLEFFFLGDGPYKNEFESYINAHPLKNIKCRFYGWVENSQTLIKDFKLLVMTSRCEGIPTVIIESLGLGVNVVAFDIPGVSKILPKNCLVETFDEEKMAKLIKESIFDKVGCNYNREYVKTLYDYERFLKQVDICFDG
jgi:glycosyltransferase involved in cell wall biosynthesis